MFSSLLLSRLRHVDEFSRGAKGREAGTSPEHAAAHPHSEATAREGKEKQVLTLQRHLTIGKKTTKTISHHLHQLLQEGHQLQQLIVILIHEPAFYGNPVRQLTEHNKKILL